MGVALKTLRCRILRKSELCSLPMLRPTLNMSPNNKFSSGLVFIRLNFMFFGCTYNFFYSWACLLIITLEYIFESGRCSTDALELITAKFL